MKTSTQVTVNNLEKAMDKTIKGIFGVSHFVLQSAADLVMESEAKMLGGDKEQVRTERLAKTYSRQDEVLARVSRAHAMLKRASDRKVQTV